MFGMGFTEILLIAVMAIIFIGPDKLPSMMVDMAKFFRNVKSTIGSVKESLEEEVNMTDIKREALAYKEELLNASEEIGKVTSIPSNITSGLTGLNDDIMNMDDTPKAPKAKKEPEAVTFSKKPKKKKEKKKEKETKENETKEDKDNINV